jgi:hypothetical protein
MLRAMADACNNPVVILLMSVLCILLVWQAAWRLVHLSSIAMRLLASRFPRSQIEACIHPLRAALAEKLPRSYALVANRLTPRRFDCLPLILIMVAALYLILLFSALI